MPQEANSSLITLIEQLRDQATRRYDQLDLRIEALVSDFNTFKKSTELATVLAIFATFLSILVAAWLTGIYLQAVRSVTSNTLRTVFILGFPLLNANLFLAYVLWLSDMLGVQVPTPWSSLITARKFFSTMLILVVAIVGTLLFSLTRFSALRPIDLFQGLLILSLWPSFTSVIILLFRGQE